MYNAIPIKFSQVTFRPRLIQLENSVEEQINKNRQDNPEKENSVRLDTKTYYKTFKIDLCQCVSRQTNKTKKNQIDPCVYECLEYNKNNVISNQQKERSILFK